jgi:hypothetical protein
MYNYLLKNGDKLCKLTITQRVDLDDYIYMRQACMPTTVKWKSIRSMVVTEHGRTLWQLSEAYLDSQEARAIGQLESPVTFIRWVSQK